MKKLLTFVLLIGILTSCETVTKKSSLPLEVIELQKLQSYDTILVIETENQVHQYDKKQEYVGSYYKKDFSHIMTFLLAFLSIALVLILISYLD